MKIANFQYVDKKHLLPIHWDGKRRSGAEVPLLLLFLKISQICKGIEKKIPLLLHLLIVRQMIHGLQGVVLYPEAKTILSVEK